MPSTQLKRRIAAFDEVAFADRFGSPEGGQETVDDVGARLLAVGGVAAVGPSAEEQQLWMDCELASLAENRLPLRADPRTFDDAVRAELTRRAMAAPGPVRLDAQTAQTGGERAVALAVRGWPLIRCDDAWQAQLDLGFSDIGGPEGLAFKIRHFEAWDREHGWRVESPRIPGLTG